MAHALRFHYNLSNGADPCSLHDIVERYIADRNAPIPGTRLVYGAMDVSDMLNMTRRPENFIEDLAEWAADNGTRGDLYDIGKFGYWDCSECGADDLDIWSFRDDCDEDEDEE